MLLNLSNHKYKTWSPAQLEAAKQQFTKVKDFSFPAIPPQWNSQQILTKAEEIISKIMVKYNDELKNKTLNILLNGEQSFIIHFYLLCKKHKIACYVATSERNTTQNKDGSKTIHFHFNQFRKV